MDSQALDSWFLIKRGEAESLIRISAINQIDKTPRAVRVYWCQNSKESTITTEFTHEDWQQRQIVTLGEIDKKTRKFT